MELKINVGILALQSQYVNFLTELRHFIENIS